MEYWISSRNVGAIFPGVFSESLACDSVFIGREKSSMPFLYNPFELYAAGVLTSPNLLVFGQIGYGKSAFVKALLARHLEIGYRGCVLDPKGEYEALVSRLKGSTFSFGRGPGSGLNPLASLSVAQLDDEGRPNHFSRLDNLVLTFSAALQREVSPIESFVLDESLTEVERAGDQTDLFDLYDVLMETRDSGAGRFGGFGAEASKVAGRLALELRRYLFGDLAGVIDGRKGVPNQPVSVDRLLHVDLFGALRPEALRVGVPVFLALLSKQLIRSSSRYLIALDEAWLALASPGCVGFFRSYWKLARGYGIANIAVVHRSEDLAASGEAGSVSEKVAKGLVGDSQTFVIFHLDVTSARVVGDLLELSSAEVALISTLGRGRCLWRVAGNSYLVDVMLTPSEESMFNTDQRMKS
ncbi:MAG: DUF87 domain-containing protein [Actinomycetota bacterium]|jgi:hypothetical protein|nr:DUF87 domain-containing protein [Actinomycetota bacterium]